MTRTFKIQGVTAVVSDLEKFAREQQKYNVNSVKLCARGMLNALSGSTKIAPKVRDVRAIEIQRQNGSRFTAFQASVPTKARRMEWRTIKRSADGHWPRTMRQAKTAPLAQIKARGLAKKTWWMIGRALGITGAANPSIQNRYQGVAALAAQESKKNFKDANPYVRIVNTLDYIQDAFYESGAKTLASLEYRAGRWIEEYARRQIEKGLRSCRL